MGISEVNMPANLSLATELAHKLTHGQFVNYSFDASST